MKSSASELDLSQLLPNKFSLDGKTWNMQILVQKVKRLFSLCNNFSQPATIDLPQVDLTILSERSFYEL